MKTKVAKDNFLYEFKNFRIHEHEFKQLPKKLQKAFLEHESMEFYPKTRAPVNPVKELKRLIKEYKNTVMKYDGVETNAECIIIDQILELMGKMYAHEIRQLKLEKLLD